MDFASRVVRPEWVLPLLILFAGCSENRISKNADNFPEEVRWVSADADFVGVLTAEPSECASETADNTKTDTINLGRLAFRSPYLLGGQATRRGLSCHSCHTNGAANADFFIQGLSGEPGTADVTNFHFSKTLGDDTFNPKPIPSLYTLSELETGQDRAHREQFVLRLVEKEFDGASPSPAIKKALLAYVNSLSGARCPTPDWQGKEVLEHQLRVIDDGFVLLEQHRSSQTDTDFIVSGLRNEMGRLHNRFPDSDHLHPELQALSLALKSGRVTDSEQILKNWQILREQFLSDFNASFYDPDFVAGKLDLDQ